MIKYYIYRFLNENNEVIYIGRTNNIVSRIATHFSSQGHLPQECYDEVKRVDYLELKTKNDMKIKELYYISKYKPIFNTHDKYDVSFGINELTDAWILFERKKIDAFVQEANRLIEEDNKKTEEIKLLNLRNKDLSSEIIKLKSELEVKNNELNTVKSKEITSQKIEVSHKSEDVSFKTAVDILLKNPTFTFFNVVEGEIKYSIYNVDDYIVGRDHHRKDEKLYIVHGGSPEMFSRELGNLKNFDFNYGFIPCIDNWVCSHEISCAI